MSVRVVNCRTYEQREDELYVYIGRPTVFGNPFVVGRDGVRGECVELYRKSMLEGDGMHADLYWPLRDLAEAHHEGIKVVLGCYCAPAPCHGDVLKELIERPFEKEGA